MRKLWRNFVRWLAAKDLDAQAELYRYLLCEYESGWRRTTENLKADRDAWKQRYEYILNLQAEAVSLQPSAPIIIQRPAGDGREGKKEGK